MKNYKRIVSIVLLIAVTICSILPTGLEARAADVTESNPMYRLYNPNSGEHFYTADEGEKDYLSGIGWNYEGIGWNAPVSSNSPVYRLYNPYSSDHHYTMDEGERDYLSQTGWNYEGIGWYSDDAKSVPLYRQFNPNEVIGTHNYTTSLEENDWLCTTGWQAEGIGWYGVRSSSDDEHENEPLVESEKSVDNYAVINLEVDPFTKSVNAKVGAPGNCKLLVRFVPEDVYFADGYYSGKEYINDGATQASCDVTASDEFVEVSSLIDNADALPDNFVAEAVLVDANGNNLCSPYTSIENTRRHEEFEAKDIYSFEGHNVVNFDEDATTNFGVLEDDVKILTAEEVVEEVNEDESKNYTITSPSENIEVGDKVYIKDGAGEYLFKVAEKNTLSDGKIFVKAARANDANHGFKIEDFFTYVDVEMEGYGEQGDEYSENEKLDSSYSDEEDVIISNEKGASVSSGYRFGPKIHAGSFEMEASISGDVTIDVDFEFDKLISREPFTCDVEYTSTQKNTISAKANKNIGEKPKLEETIGKVSIPIVPIFIDAYMEVGLEVSCQLSAGFTAEGTSSVEAGFHYNSFTGYVPFSQKSNTWEIKATGEVEIKAGPTASVGIEILYGAVGVELEGFIGLAAKATIEAGTGNDDHACTVCASGELKACTELSLNVECLYGFLEPFDATLISAEIKLFDFYVSIVNPKGKIEFGKGECRYKSSAWKKVYIDYLERYSTLDDYKFCLVYINDDDIPELIGQDGVIGKATTVYYGEDISMLTYMDGCKYIPKANLLYTNCNDSLQYIYEIDNGEWKEIANLSFGGRDYDEEYGSGKEWKEYFNGELMNIEDAGRNMAYVFGNGIYTLEGHYPVAHNPNERSIEEEKWYTKDELIKTLREMDF